jgi:disulfide bond formation protein DsbB
VSAPRIVLPAAGARTLLALIVAVMALSMAGALYFQYVLNLEPCPLCVLQRMAIIAAGIAAALGLAIGAGLGQVAAALLALLFSLAGAGIAGWHSWLLAAPHGEALSCGRPFEWFHDDFPLAVWLPKLFAGQGDCSSLDWTFLGLAIPHLSLIAFAMLIAMALLATRAAWRRR